MQLTPVSKSASHETPAYPRREIRTPTWLQRAITIAAVTLTTMGLLGCDGRLKPVDDIVDGPGVMIEPSWSFICGAEVPETVPTLSFYPENEGELCGEDVAWSALDVDETGAFRFSLVSGAELAAVALIDPDDEQKAQLDVDTPTLDVELTPGRWLVAVTAQDPLNEPDASFMLSVSML